MPTLQDRVSRLAEIPKEAYTAASETKPIENRPTKSGGMGTLVATQSHDGGMNLLSIMSGRLNGVKDQLGTELISSFVWPCHTACRSSASVFFRRVCDCTGSPSRLSYMVVL